MPRFITGKKKDIWNKSLYQMYKSIFDTVPMWSGSSCMVNDFPEPVCPYAKTVELYLQNGDYLLICFQLLGKNDSIIQ